MSQQEEDGPHPPVEEEEHAPLKKREREDPLPPNDARVKLREPLAEWDQSVEEGELMLAKALRDALEGKKLSVRAAMDAACRSASFTKRGERLSTSSYVKARYGGAKPLMQKFESDGLLTLSGDWKRSDVVVNLTGDAVADDATAGDAKTPSKERRKKKPPINFVPDGRRYRGVCSFWDRKRGWGFVQVEAADGQLKVYCHTRDLAKGVKAVPRGATVTCTIRSTDKGLSAKDVEIEATTDQEVDNLAESLVASTVMMSDDAAA